MVKEKNKTNLKSTRHKAVQVHKKTTDSKKGPVKKMAKFLRFFRQFAFWVFIFSLILCLLLPAGFYFVYWDRVFPNIKAGHLDLSGKTKDEAITVLKNEYTNFNDQKIVFEYYGNEWNFTLADLGFNLNVLKTAEKAYSYGREANPIVNFLDIISSIKQSIKIPLSITVNDLAYSNTIRTLSDEVNLPMSEATLIVGKDNNITLTPGISGRKVDEAVLQKLIIDNLNRNTYQINLPVINLVPLVSHDKEEDTKKRAENLINKQLNLLANENNYEVSGQELINLITFTGDFSMEKIASLTANLSEAFDTKPQNAAFLFENGRVTVFKPSKEGHLLDQNKNLEVISQALVELEATSSAKLEIALKTIPLPPEITTDKVNDLGIKELIGKGLSFFRGSIASRIHNIILASSKINGILIKPGDTFSFNEAVGDISAATGFQQAYIIQNGRTVLGDGGGVCQVSTTLFRAALNAGLPIIERQAHAYRVAYYEQGFGAGLDATVFAPTVDLKFKNDTPAHILIQTTADTKNLSLIFELYGAKDGRISSVSTPRIWDQSPPPPPKYEDDPTLPIGTEKQVDFAAWGAKAAFDYKVTRNNEVLINKTFYSNFKPWQAVYLKGTKQ